MNNDLSAITFDDLFKNLHLTQNELKKFSEPKPIDVMISPLRAICNSVGSSKPYKPLFVPEEYKQQWEDYLSKRKNPELRALRYLCWEPDIASDKRFIDCLRQEQMSLSARSLSGIVRACHLRWSNVLKESVFKKGNLLEAIKELVKKYHGPNRILQKWNNSIDTILSAQGPKLFATAMTKNFKPIKEYAESWGVDVQSEFFKDHSMIQASENCFHNNDLCHYLFNELLAWQLWSNTPFKGIIAKLILDGYYQQETLREILQNFVLSDDRLGDPRLRRNSHKWVDMDKNAHDAFIQWLSRDDIVFFFEHVLPRGHDPHGRKEFWLKYFKQFTSSRPMLCPLDENRLRITSMTMQNKIKSANFGKINANNSVFLLAFGTIVAVEFSVIGASYVYKSEDFKKIFPDFWSMKSYSESDFRRQNMCIGRIVHDRHGRWKKEMSNLLSMNGIRPS